MLCALAASPALGVIPGNTDPNLFAGPWAGMDWSYLYRWRNGTAVAVADSWVLTASHMGASVGDSIDVGGQTYFVEQVRRCPADSGQSVPVDLTLLRMDRKLPGYYGLYYGTFPTNPKPSAIMVGYGVTGTDHGTYYTMDGEGGIERWGTNKISTEIRVATTSYSSQCIGMHYLSGATQYEAGFGSGDSGGGTFVEDGGEWKLAGINVYVTTNGSPGQYNYSYAVSVPAYAGWILSTIPQPTRWQHDPKNPGDWFTGSDWTDGVPTSSRDAYVDNGGTARISSGIAEAGYLFVGADSSLASAVEQTGGTCTIGEALHLGFGPNSTGNYHLSASGGLSALREYIGSGGSGKLTQTGGINTAGSVLIGPGMGPGRYEWFGGTLETADMELGANGTLAMGFVCNLADIASGSLFDGTLTGLDQGTLEVTNGATMTFADGNVTVGSLIVGSAGGAGRFVQSGGTVYVVGRVSGTGRTTISDGDMSVSAIDQGSLIVSGGKLTIHGSSKTTSTVQALSISGPGEIDTKQNLLKVDYSADGNTVMPTILSWIESGAILSTDSNVCKDLGYFDDTLNKQVRVMFTWKGNVNCDDDVDLVDLSIMGTYYNIITDGTAKWYHGNVNKDGNVDLLDLSLLGAFHDRPPGTLTLGGVAAVPEPATLGLLLTGGGVMLLRARTRRARR